MKIYALEYQAAQHPFLLILQQAVNGPLAIYISLWPNEQLSHSLSSFKHTQQNEVIPQLVQELFFLDNSAAQRKELISSQISKFKEFVTVINK